VSYRPAGGVTLHDELTTSVHVTYTNGFIRSVLLTSFQRSLGHFTGFLERQQKTNKLRGP
jgi:hypothetical protein